LNAFVSSTDSIGTRLRAARERLGLSTEQAAARMRLTPVAVSLMEKDDDEIASCYTLADIARFAGVLRTTSRELFDIPATVLPLKLNALKQLIREHCQSRHIRVRQFEEAVGWPEGMNIADLPSVSIADICKELGVDWRRVFAGCDETT
jgi:transcriptional regulator with XRE-family HTH domain